MSERRLTPMMLLAANPVAYAEHVAHYREYMCLQHEDGLSGPLPSEARQPETATRVAERAQIPALFLSARLGNWLPDNGSERLRCASYIALWPPEKPLLLLVGDKGAGKTHLACAVLHEAYERHGQRGQFWPVVDLMDRFRRTQDSDRATESLDDVINALKRLPLLVVDDYGVQRDTGFATERLYDVFDWRYREMKPLIVTSNVGLMGLEERVRDRFTQTTVATVVQFVGGSKRAAS